ncbi:MAG: FAD-dependent oxidoreductase [Acidobacteriota bacterium]
MIFDSNELTDLVPSPYDICIIGSGPAGLVVANELRASGLRLAVLESGQLEKTGHADRLKTVVTTGGIPIKHASRERVLGGASLTWDGLSAPLEPIDLAERPWVPLSGWPIRHFELLSFYRQAADRYGFPPPEAYDVHRFSPLKAEGDYSFSWKNLVERVVLAPVRPQRFGRLLRTIFDSPGLHLFTDATATDLIVRPSGEAIHQCLARTRGGKIVTFRSTVFVLAAGGIENARLLLNSKIGNEYDQVGRYFMNHPKNPSGLVVPARPVSHLPAYFGCLYRGKAAYLALRLADELQERLGTLNSYVRFEPLYTWSDTAGVQLLINYVKSKRWLWENLKSFKGESSALRDYAETGDDPDIKLVGEAPSLFGLLLAMLKDSPAVAQYGFYRVFDRLRPRVRALRIRNFMEMEPHPDNRVMLSGQKDLYGKPIPVVRHSATSLDKRSLLEIHRVLGEELKTSGFGDLVSDLTDCEPWPINADASHHMGSTRMGSDPRTSVVDSNCLVHGVRNLYVAGSSVFPTSGYANPTYTIVALAIRLAEHLRAAVQPLIEKKTRSFDTP